MFNNAGTARIRLTGEGTRSSCRLMAVERGSRLRGGRVRTRVRPVKPVGRDDGRDGASGGRLAHHGETISNLGPRRARGRVQRYRVVGLHGSTFGGPASSKGKLKLSRIGTVRIQPDARIRPSCVRKRHEASELRIVQPRRLDADCDKSFHRIGHGCRRVKDDVMPVLKHLQPTRRDAGHHETNKRARQLRLTRRLFGDSSPPRHPA